jgi:four helix bundle protein
MEKEKIKQFSDLVTWQKARVLVLDFYTVSIEFPKEELFGLTSQMKRSVISVSSNIAEGFGRWSPKDKAHFYQQANGSLTEFKSQLYLALDLKYISQEQFAQLTHEANETHFLLLGLIKSARARDNA